MSTGTSVNAALKVIAEIHKARQNDYQYGRNEQQKQYLKQKSKMERETGFKKLKLQVKQLEAKISAIEVKYIPFGEYDNTEVRRQDADAFRAAQIEIVKHSENPVKLSEIIEKYSLFKIVM